MGSGSEVQNLLEDSSVEILNKPNSAQNVLKERLHMNFIFIKSKGILSQKSGERLIFNKTVIIYMCSF
jgi:hypothetical protein